MRNTLTYLDQSLLIQLYWSKSLNQKIPED